MSKPKRYKVETDNFTEALRILVEQFKATEPSIGRFRATCHDGSTVDIRIRDHVRKTEKPKHPIKKTG